MSGTTDAAIGAINGANTSTIADAAGAAAVAKTCVEAMDAKPDVDGKYVMFAKGEYTVFERVGTTTNPAGIDTNVNDARFFKVLPDDKKGGGKRKSRKSSKKQRKSSKKQHKSSRKQRKSRGSRRSKK